MLDNFKSWKSLKKKHFKKARHASYRKIWDLEFVKNQLKMMRENWRAEYDRTQEQVDAATLRLSEEQKKEDPDKTIIENLTKALEKWKPDIEELKKRMDGCEKQIEGYDNSEGHNEGINDTIEGHRANIKLIEVHLKNLWAKKNV